MRIVLSVALAVVLVSLSNLTQHQFAQAQSDAQFGRNLILNGGAEAGPGAPDDEAIIPPPQWTVTTGFTAVRYGAPGGFLSLTDPGPPDRGRNYFTGGPKNARSTATQTIILTAGSEIDAGAVTYRLAGYLGTCEAEDDQATVLMTFQTGAGAPLGEATIGPVTSDHFRNKGGLLLRAVTGTVPRETRRVVVTLVMTRLSGSYNDASADSIVFEVVRR